MGELTVVELLREIAAFGDAPIMALLAYVLWKLDRNNITQMTRITVLLDRIEARLEKGEEIASG